MKKFTKKFMIWNMEQLQSRCVGSLKPKRAIRVGRSKQQIIFKTTAGLQLLTAECVLEEVLRYINIYYY